MKKFIADMKSVLTEQLEAIKLANTSLSDELESSLQEISAVMRKLKTYVEKFEFSSVEEEIHFFKIEKPFFLSRFIFYNEAYRMENFKPAGSKQIMKDYYVRAQKEIKRFSAANRDFVKYYRTGSSFLDHKYYVRNHLDLKLCLESYTFELDPTFSTAMDYKLSFVMGNDLLRVFIDERMAELDITIANNQKEQFRKSELNWTGSKSSLVELVYAVQSSGNINNGATDIRVVADTFQHMFNIELTDVYRIFQDIKGRNNPTKFLRQITEQLEQKIREELN